MRDLVALFQRGLADADGLRVLGTKYDPMHLGCELIFVTYRGLFIKLAKEWGNVDGEIGLIGGLRADLHERLAAVGAAPPPFDQRPEQACHLGALVRQHREALASLPAPIVTETPRRPKVGLYQSLTKPRAPERSEAERFMEVLREGPVTVLSSGIDAYHEDLRLTCGNLFVDVNCMPDERVILLFVSQIGGEMVRLAEAMDAIGRRFASPRPAPEVLAASILESHEALAAYLASRPMEDACERAS